MGSVFFVPVVVVGIDALLLGFDGDDRRDPPYRNDLDTSDNEEARRIRELGWDEATTNDDDHFTIAVDSRRFTRGSSLFIAALSPFGP